MQTINGGGLRVVAATLRVLEVVKIAPRTAQIVIILFMPESVTQEIRVGEEQAGTRLDVFVAAQLQVSRGRAQVLLENTTVNGAPEKAKYNVKVGDRVLVFQEQVQDELVAHHSSHNVLPLPPILFEDEHLIVLNKPRGVVVHAGSGETGATLVEIFESNGRQLSSVGAPDRAGIVHRLDKDTTGVMALCKTDAAHWKLASDFAERRVQKNYLALVCGVPPKKARVEAPIARSPRDRKKMAVAHEGRNAITEYSTVQNWQKFALLDVNLLTGRTHQIRVHLNYINHPVVADTTYGGYKRALESSQTEDVRAAIAALGGQALHAAKLAFAHPITEEALEFEAPLPDDFARVLEVLRAA